MNEYRNMAGPLPRYHQGPPTEGNKNYQYHGQHPYYQSNPAMGQNQWYQHGYGYTQNRKPLTCGPCNRTFYSQQKMDEHLKEHVDCPFPECKLSAHIKVIDQHINNQHMLVNFEALQIDDETWIAERKKRFPSAQRAELRRVQQMEKLKRGEKLGVSKRPFNKDKMVKNKRGRDGKWIPNKDTKKQNLPSEVDNDKTNVEAKSSSNGDSVETKKNFRHHVKKGKNSQDSLEARKTNFEDKRMRKRPRLENSLKPSIDVDLYESDEEVLGVPPFKGSRHFYESTGEVNYFSVSNLSRNLPEKEFVISDDEEWEERNKDDKKMVLGGALGSLMGAYSDSEEEMEDKTAAEPSIKVKTNLSKTADQTSSPKMITENVVNQTAKEESSRGRGKRRPRTHNKKGKKPINIQRRSRRRKPLLEKLLEADIIHERNIILQCVRYIIENDFFDEKVVGKADTEEPNSQKGLCDSIKDISNDTITMPDKLVVSNDDSSDLSRNQIIESEVLGNNGHSTESKSELCEDTRDNNAVAMAKSEIVSEENSLACVLCEDKSVKQINDIFDEKVAGKAKKEEPSFQNGLCGSIKDKISDTVTIPEKFIVSNNGLSDLPGDQILEPRVLVNNGISTEGESESHKATHDNNDAHVLVKQEIMGESKSLACVSSENESVK
ncbi:uncharacterized protein Nufip [Palaemon carinicauda]|uniref:uncharacterized protein Nufip n=1 Tax=Palaemon carinicauda TaxID=392227 RepID=UPI0035B662F5